MLLRDLVRQTWADAGVYDIRDARLQRFLQYVEGQRVECWPEIAGTFRRRFPEYFRVLVPPLVAVEDRALRIHLIASIDRDNKDDMAMLRSAVAQADPDRHRFELDALRKRDLLAETGGGKTPDTPDQDLKPGTDVAQTLDPTFGKRPDAGPITDQTLKPERPEKPPGGPTPKRGR